MPPILRRQILDLPGDHPFNGSVIDTPSGRLILYRYSKWRIACAYLDERFKMVGSERLLPLYRSVDPRVIRFGDRLLLSTSFSLPNDVPAAGLAPKRMELRELAALGDGAFEIVRETRFETIEDDPGYVRQDEKNWTPWLWEGGVYYSHWVNPHRVLKVDMERGAVALKYSTSWAACPWRPQWGTEFRLNAPPVRLADGRFLSTFHTVHAGRYYTGFYSFEPAPPFRVTAMSRSPVFSPVHVTGVNYRSGRPCLFITGLILDEARGELIASGGDNGHSVVVFTLDLAAVLEGLAPVAGA